jgi:uncharacterized membrane protein (DUF4010 family)
MIGLLIAAASNTGFVSAIASPMITGICGLIMPAFYPAIASSVLPNKFI